MMEMVYTHIVQLDSHWPYVATEHFEMWLMKLKN